MSEQTISLDAHLPLDRRLALSQNRDLPERAWGSILFADLSGFTPLMEHLARTLGPQQGAEELTHLLNAIFTPMIGEVHRYEGSIVAFGGDALTCWFPGALEASAPRAAAAVLAMHRHLGRFEAIETPAGPLCFSIHSGIASGQVLRCPVGQPPHGILDVLAGESVDRMAEAQHRAGTNQAIVDATTAAHLPPAACQGLEEGFGLLRENAAEILPSPVDVPPPPRPLPARQARQWLSGPLYHRLQAGRGTFAAELRLVTSMFVQFAGLDYDHDPQVTDKLRRYVNLAQEHMAPYEGHLGLVACGDKGSMLLVLFGAPIAHEDDPERAVGFALDFREAVRALPFISAQRIGISLGRVYAGILGSPARCTYTVLGDEVNISARLMQAAADGQILASQWVQQAAGERYTFEPLGAIPVKGKANPVPLFEPTAPRERLLERAEKGPLVGREQESTFLDKLLAGTAAGRGSVLQIEGEAGVGKSALLRTLLHQAQAQNWALQMGTGLSYGQNTPYLPWRAVLEGIACFGPEIGPAEQAACLEQAVANLPDPPDRPGYWEARFPLLAEVMGLEVPETPLTRTLEGELRRDNTFQLLEALVRHQAAERPALIVLEDAHWADELSLALAAQVGRGLADRPLLLVLVHRPFAASVPAAVRALGSLAHSQVLSLDTLSEAAALELARQRLQAGELDPALEELLRERARGNPFFVEELLRSLQEGGHLRRRDGAVELSGDWAASELPDTIEGLVRARMDRVPEEERLTLKVSSVIGRTFQRAMLGQVHPARPTSFTLDRQLGYLGRADFTQMEEGAPEWRYAFRHPILHEVTYETLLFAQRRQLHGAIGGVLEDWHAGDLPRVLDLLAYHYARSEQREKAVHYLQRAGDKARREYANEVALGYYSQALERLRPEELEQRYELLAGRERIRDLLGERTAQEEDLAELGRLAEELADPRRQVEVLNRRARRAVDMGAFEEAQELAQTAQDQAEGAHDQAGAAKARKLLGIIHAILGEYDEASEAFARTQKMYAEMGDYQGEAASLSNLGLVYFYRGNAEQARAHYARVLELAKIQDNRLQETRALINLGLAESNLGAYDQALSSLNQALAISQEIGSAASEALALDNIGVLEMALGELDQAAKHQQRALQLARLQEDQEGEAASLSNLGLLSAYQNNPRQARLFLEQALRQFREIGYRRGEASVLHYRGLVELGAREISTAKAFFEQALVLRQEIGEVGNLLSTKAWLACARAEEGEQDLARSYIIEVLDQLRTEGYGGDEPEQEIWWAAYQIWLGCGEQQRANQSLEQAHQLVQAQAGRIQDPALRRSFLEQVPVNREIVRAWEEHRD